MKNKLNKNVLPKEVRMQTETIYTVDGRVYTNPCHFEEQAVHHDDTPLKQRGSCWIKPDGTMTFRPFNVTGKKAYTVEYEGEAAQVRYYKHFGEVRIRFPYDCTKREQMSYIQKQLDLVKKAMTPAKSSNN